MQIRKTNCLRIDDMTVAAASQEKNMLKPKFYRTPTIRDALGLTNHAIHGLARSGVALASPAGNHRAIRRQWPLVDALSLATASALQRLTGRTKWAGEAVTELLVIGEAFGGDLPDEAVAQDLSNADAARLIAERAASLERLPVLYRDALARPVVITASLDDPRSEPALHFGGIDIAKLGNRAGLIAVNLSACLNDFMDRLDNGEA